MKLSLSPSMILFAAVILGGLGIAAPHKKQNRFCFL